MPCPANYIHTCSVLLGLFPLLLFCCYCGNRCFLCSNFDQLPKYRDIVGTCALIYNSSYHVSVSAAC